MMSLQSILTLAFLAVTQAAPASDVTDQTARAEVAQRRVAISISFTGESVFLHGQVPTGTEMVLAEMKSPPIADLRLMRKGKVVLFYMGVRQYELSGVPALYQLNVSCRDCPGTAPCDEPVDLDSVNRILEESGSLVGKEALIQSADLHVLSGDPETEEISDVIEGFWELQAAKGLYAINCNAIRINEDGLFSHTFRLMTESPQGKYRVTTYFLGDNKLLGMRENSVFVRQTGTVAWLSSLAERRAMAYGIYTLIIAVLAGWLAGLIFKKGGGGH